MDLHLTNEQAEWLKEHLGHLISDVRWGMRNYSADALEHCETIFRKISENIKKESWD